MSQKRDAPSGARGTEKHADARWNLGPLTRGEILALPAVVPFVDAARAFGLKRTQAHEMVKRGEFPVPLMQRGRARFALQSDILAELRITDLSMTVDQRTVAAG